jgi:predicted membrane-bound mannosyltransferase/DNA-binding beta-propeller fold protein YncE
MDTDMTQTIPQHNITSTPIQRIRTLLVALIIALAIISRFALLGERVMSHDEINHVVPSYELSQGKGYVHSPITHGPFQFHIVALTYFLFGDNDTTSRIPAALFSVASVLFVLIAFPRYLGRSGALIAGALFTISPFMMFYGRYTRNEAFIELIGVVLLYGLLRYLEKGDALGMTLVTLATGMHFIVKETAFIYTAQALIFLFLVFLIEVRGAMQGRPGIYNRFLTFMAVALLAIILTLGIGIIKARQEKAAMANPVPTANQPEQTEASAGPTSYEANPLLVPELIVIAIAGISGLAGIWTISKGMGWDAIKQLRSFSLLLLIGTLIFPMLSPFPVRMLGWDPLDYSSTASILRTGAFVLLFLCIATAIGLWWNPVLWRKNAFIFYAMFTVFYTTFFTNPNGLLTGMVGSLGYWLSQQSFERGTQPLYYYALIQMPVYEFLACFGTLLAAYFGIRNHCMYTYPNVSPALSSIREQIHPNTFGVEADGVRSSEWNHTDDPSREFSNVQPIAETAVCNSISRPVPVLALLLFWSLTSLVAYSLAGERMPWLTVHIALPCLLASGWGLGYLIDTTHWCRIWRMESLLTILLLPVFVAGLSNLFRTLSGDIGPFQGNSLEQLQVTSRFLLSVATIAVTTAGLTYLLRHWLTNDVLRLFTTLLVVVFAVLTARAAYRASFIYYDYAYEYLVYAHAAPAPKEALQLVETISHQTVGEKALRIAYGGDALYPYWWYLRDYPNSHYFGTEPTRELRDTPVIIAGDDLFEKMTPIVRDDYIQFDYMRLWWPNENYMNLTWERVWEVITNPQMRSAIWQIWLNRDYRSYATLTGQTTQFAPETWHPSERMRLYIRKDTAAKTWSISVALAAIETKQVDPYEKQMADFQPLHVIGSAGTQPGQFQSPRGIKIASDGSMYIADSRNHRIQHLAPDGSVLAVWGSFADVSQGEAPGGTFNEPWDVAIGNDGSIYVADTWNHRIQKFTASGSFLKTWGYFGQGEQPDAFWGPRGLAVDAQGRVFVVDTGNKRVVVFDAGGSYITQFGSAGFGPGQLDEPVGISIDPQGNVYVTDTWNQRVQVFSPTNAKTNEFLFSHMWDVDGWVGQSLENKPYIAFHPVTGTVLITDPEGPRVLEFSNTGVFHRGWGTLTTNTNDRPELINGIAVDHTGAIWITDAVNCMIYQLQ